MTRRLDTATVVRVRGYRATRTGAAMGRTILARIFGLSLFELGAVLHDEVLDVAAAGFEIVPAAERSGNVVSLDHARRRRVDSVGPPGGSAA